MHHSHRLMYQLVIGDMLEAHSLCVCEHVCVCMSVCVWLFMCACVSVYVTVCDLTLFITLWLTKYWRSLCKTAYNPLSQVCHTKLWTFSSPQDFVIQLKCRNWIIFFNLLLLYSFLPTSALKMHLNTLTFSFLMHYDVFPPPKWFS